MNKNHYRLLYNPARNQLMVVPEHASSKGGSNISDSSSGATDHARTNTSHAPLGAINHYLGRLKHLSFAALRLLAMPAVVSLATLSAISTLPAQAAGLAVDATAPANQRPLITNAANGVPVVNIQTPSAAGVSHNTYSQFDVTSQGVILNNSSTNLSTQLGGYIQGNPYLPGSTARVILNEVNSPNPSLLHGYIEVAGSRAQVIVANPSGISCDGCGFINTSRATLTTGIPLMSGGDLIGYRVTGGTINFLGAGLDTANTNYTDVIARAVQVNANLFANKLNVITGSNQVNVASAQNGTDAYISSITPLAPNNTVSNPSPAFAIDVAALGGMYAGKIHLIATEAGVGVRSAGNVGASAGNVVIDANGTLSNSGTLSSGGAGNHLAMNTQGLDNSGTISAQNNISIHNQGALQNSGLITADRELKLDTSGQLTNNHGTLSAQRLDIHAASLSNNQGTIQQTGLQALSLTTQGLTNVNNAVIGNIPVLAGGTAGATTGNGSAGNASTGAAGTSPTTAANGSAVVTTASAPVLLADGVIMIQGLSNNDGGQITANGKVTATVSHTLANSASINLATIDFTGASFSNANGSINVAQAMIYTNLLDNSQGQFIASDTLHLAAHDVRNVQGNLQQLGLTDLSIDLLGNLDNTQGHIETNATSLTLGANQLTNNGGSIIHAGTGALNITSTTLNGTGGVIQSNGILDITATTATVDQGTTIGKQLNINTATLSNKGGHITQTGTANTSISASTGLDNSGGTIASNANTSLTVGSLINQGGLIQAAGSANLTLNATGAIDNSALNGVAGNLQAGGSATLTASSLNNSQSKITAGNTLSVTTTQATNLIDGINNSQGRIAADQGVTLNAGAGINNTLAHIESAAGAISLNAVGAFNNSSGVVNTQQNLHMAATTLNNADGQLSGLDTDVATTGLLDNAGLGTILAQHDLSLNTGKLNNQNVIQASHDLSINATDTVSNSGNLYAHGNTNISTQGNLNNSGTLAALGNTSIHATGSNSQINSSAASVLAAGLNTDGTLGTSGNLDVTASQSIAALGHNLSAGDQSLIAQALDLTGSNTVAHNINLSASNGNLNATNAIVQASNTLTASSTQTLTTDAAKVSAQQLNLTAHDLSNVAGELIQTGSGDTTIHLVGDLNNNQGRIATNSTHLSITANTITNTSGNVNGNSRPASIEHAGTGNFNLVATTLNGTGGLIQSNGILGITATTATVDQGTTIGKQLNINTATLSNKGGQITQTGTANTSISASTGLDNSGGTIASNANTSLTVGSLINQGGLIQAAGSANLTLNATGAIDNSALNGVAGNLQAGGSATLTAASLNNSQSKITAGNTLSVTTVQAIDNSQGLLAANQQVAVTATSINNSSGTVASVQAGVDLHATTGHINNTLGQLTAAQTLNTNSVGLNNTDGTLLANQISTDSQLQAFDNTRGSIISSTSLDVQTGVLTNAAGLMQSGNTLTINTHGQTLTNSNSGSNKGILSQGTLSLTTGDLNNQSGFMGAKGAIAVNSAAIINGVTIANTTAGVITSEATIALNASSLNNQAGHIEALANIDVNVGNGIVNNSANNINNQQGLLRSGQTLGLSAGSIDNRNTQGSNQGIEAHNVSIAADAIDNTIGAIRADNLLRIVDSGSLNNSQGLISSSSSLTIADAQANTNSNVATKTLGMTNAGGTIIANQALTIDSASLTGDGTILSGGDLAVQLLGDYTQSASAKFQASGNVSLATTGNLTNLGKLTAGSKLNLAAANINNTANAEMSAANTQLTATQTLTNRGLIDGSDTFIETGTLNNLGTGRIYGDHIAIAATNLNNDVETLGGVSHAAVIAARSRLDLGVSNTITNREHALIFSASDMAIAGSLDASHLATTAAGSTQAATLNNNSATIEALGNVSLNVADINNTNAHFSTQVVQLSSTPMNEYQGSGSPSRYSTGLYIARDCDEAVDCLHTPDGNVYKNFYQYSYNRTITETQITSSDPAKILAGSVMQINANTLLNDNSTLIAGGALTANIGTLTNTQVAGEHIITDAGQAIYYFRVHHTFQDNNTHSNTSGYAPAPSVQAINLATSKYASHTAITGSGTTVAALNTTAVGQTATGANVAGASINNAANQSGGSQVGSINAASAGATSAITQTVNPNVTLPNNSLFHTNPNSANHYLIETDRAFADYRTWLSSDYMLAQLSVDPATITKRLGDGFYEQKLIREQINQLTGRRFLSGYANDQAQYQALMNNGVTSAKAFNLTPGVALSAAQIAQLTSDIVWLVQQTITLPAQYDLTGKLMKAATQTQALVPHVYVRVKAGDLNANGQLLSGALISADSINLNITGDLTNSNGTIAGRSVLALNAHNVNNLGGRLTANNVNINAAQDINNLGGSIDASNSLSASAGHDLNVMSTTSTQTNAQGSRTNINRVAGLYITGDASLPITGTLVASAGHDLHLGGAQVINNGTGTSSTTQLSAGHDVSLGTVNTSEQNNITWNSKNYLNQGSSLDNGTQIQSNGNISINAGHDANLKAANIDSNQGNLSINTANDINITTGQSTHSLDSAHQVKSKGFLSKTTRSSRDTINSTDSIGSSLSADSITLNAGKDLNVQGSNVVATHDTNLNAGGDIKIESAQNTLNETHVKDTKKSGLMSSGGVGFTIGKRQLTTTNDTQSVTNTASTVGSVQGNTNITAGKAYTQTGSDVLAPQGDVNILAQQVNIAAAQNTSSNTQTTKFKQSGITVSLSNPIVSAAQTVQQMATAASHTKDGRMQALAAGTAALSASNALDALKAGQADQYGNVATAGNTGKDDLTHVAQGNIADKVGGINLSISIGSSKSSSSSTQTSNTAQSSHVSAGKDINIKATGAGKDSDINIIGSQVKAGNNVSLIADDQINLAAAQNTATLNSTNKSSSASIGVSVGLGSAGAGLTGNASFNKSRGSANGNDVTYTETVVQAGNKASDKATLTSGRDTNIIGSQVIGNQIIANVGFPSPLAGEGQGEGVSKGGNLNIISLQDSSTYNDKQSSSGFSINVPIYGAGSAGASINASNSHTNSNYQSVQQQAGIFAGNGGFQVNVNGNTDLKGAVIASSAEAAQSSVISPLSSAGNSLRTQTLTTSNIENKAEYKANASSFSAGIGSQKGASAGNAHLNDNSNSVTVSGISGGQISLTGNGTTLTSPAGGRGAGGEGLSGADQIAHLNRDVQTSLQTTEDGRQIATAVDSKGNNLAGTLTPIFDKEQVQRELAAQVRITQAFSQVAPKAVGDYASNKFKELMAAGNKEEAAKWADGGIYRVALHTIVGGLSGNLEGALGAGTSAAAIPRIAEQIKALDIPTELKEALILATASAIGSVTGGTTGAGAALSEAGNNYLKHAEAQRMDTLLRQKAQGQCGTACEQEIASLTTLDNSRNQALQGCANVSTPDCNTARQEVRNAAAEYILANVQGTVLRYAQEKGETLTLAQQTLSGLGSAELKGFSTAIVDGIANALKGGYIAIAALGGDEASSEKVGQFGASLAQFLKVPGNWQALVGGLSKDDREKLAAAYAAGDGDTVGRIIGAQVASIPIAGAELGVGTKLAKLAKAAGVVNVAEKTKELIRVAEAANVTEAAKYTNRLDVSYRSASEVNTKEFSADYNPPYQVGTRVTEYTTKDADQFVRVSLGEQAAGQWMMRKEAIQGLTPEQIAQKYSLPAAPQYISDVNVPAGTQVRTGSVATNFGGNQGAIQYQLISPIPNNSFTNTRPLR